MAIQQMMFASVPAAPSGPAGYLFGWGGNQDGAVGDGTETVRNSPVIIGALATWQSVSGGFFGVKFGIKSDGTLWAWGTGTSGRLGLDSTTDYSSPVQVGLLTDWSQISAHHGALAVKTDGTLWSWGDLTPVLGHNDGIARSSPVQVGALTDWSVSKSAHAHAFAIKTDGTLWAWGTGTSGQLGHNNKTSISSPAKVGVLTDWASTGEHDAASGSAVKTDGTLWTWGAGNWGRLGHGSTTSFSSPVKVGLLTNWAQVDSSYNEKMAVKTDGTLWGWGRNYADKTLGAGAVGTVSSPIQIGALTDWSIVDLRGAFSLGHAIKTDGTLWGWGEGSGSSIGVGNTTDYISPVQIGAAVDWIAITTGGIGVGYGEISAIREV